MQPVQGIMSHSVLQLHTIPKGVCVFGAVSSENKAISILFFFCKIKNPDSETKLLKATTSLLSVCRAELIRKLATAVNISVFPLKYQQETSWNQ